MNPFFESFLKELGSGLAKVLWIGLIILCAVAGFSLPRDMITARVILLCLAGLLILALSIYVVYRYRSYRKTNKTNSKPQKTSKSIPDSSMSDLEVSELHHPDLRDSRYSNSVLWCSIVNKSDTIVTINDVRAYDSADRLLPTAWSNGLRDNLGNLSDFTGLLAIKSKDTASIYLRHRHGTDIYICRIEIYHSLSDTPIIKAFDAYDKWNL